MSKFKNFKQLKAGSMFRITENHYGLDLTAVLIREPSDIAYTKYNNGNPIMVEDLRITFRVIISNDLDYDVGTVYGADLTDLSDGDIEYLTETEYNDFKW